MNDTKTEFELSQKEFENLRDIITGETGIQLPDHKKTLMYSRLVRRLRALNLPGFSQYHDYVKAQIARGDNTELGEMVNAMTTNVTALFRENHHFEYLRDNLSRLHEKFGKVRIWSAACSTGEEPWSIAMVVADHLAKNPGQDIKIMATDLDTTAVQKARLALFMLNPEDREKNPYLKKYLKRTERENTNKFSNEQEFVISDDIRKLITFQQMNLLKPWPALEPQFHVVFCRNVVIYFSKDTQRSLFVNIEKKMPEGSILCIGHSESLINVSNGYKLVGTTTYEKKPESEIQPMTQGV